MEMRERSMLKANYYDCQQSKYLDSIIQQDGEICMDVTWRTKQNGLKRDVFGVVHDQWMHTRLKENF